jgi:hypothetical protein
MKILVATLGLLFLPFAAQASGGCGSHRYRGINDECVYSPHTVAAVCNDGYVSYSNFQGTCSRHGGIRFRTHPGAVTNPFSDK